MTPNKQAMICYLATLGAIVALALAGAGICIAFEGNETQLAKIIASLAFIAAAISGLVGVIGTFRPKGEDNSAQAAANLGTLIDKLPPQTTGTGPSKPYDEVENETSR